MIDALSLYGRMIGVSIRAQMQYRVSFLLMSLGHFVTTGVEMLGVWALFDRFGDLLPWTLPQVAFFYGVVNISFAFTDALARGFDLFGAQFVKTGNFDRVLLRPRSTVLQLAGHEFTLFRVGRLLQGVIVLVWACQHLAIEWDMARVALLAFAMLATFLFFYGLVILGAVMSFWTTESLEIMNTVTYGGVETAQYPLAIYQQDFRRFFTYVVPLGCVTYFPLVAILGIDDPLGTSSCFRRSLLRADSCSSLRRSCFGASAFATTRRLVRETASPDHERALRPGWGALAA
jgi:ABC-2 type transport system permease protein